MTTLARSPRLLVLSAFTLAVFGAGLLGVPDGQQAPAPAPSLTAHATTRPSPAAPASGTDVPAVGVPASTPAASTPAADGRALPPHGDGTASDEAIQKALEDAWPPDLPPGDARELLAAGRGLLRADATGIGRARWPAAFPASQEGLAPAFAPARFRIQAAIARRDAGPDTAVVHLVWAGTDRGGTYTDGRLTDLYFTRTTWKGATTWVPRPRT